MREGGVGGGGMGEYFRKEERYQCGNICSQFFFTHIYLLV